MKTKLLLIIQLFSVSIFAQQKSTGVINLGSSMTAELILDNSTQQATLRIAGPNDRWFALKFGSFTAGMGTEPDMVYYNGTSLIDATQNNGPSNDTNNNWTIVSNNNNTPVSGRRTIVATRPFNTNDIEDYVFNYLDATIDFAWARSSTASYSLAYHGGNRGLNLNIPLSTLSSESFTKDSVKIFPNPSSENFYIYFEDKINDVEEINIYNNYGKKINHYKKEQILTDKLNVNGLSSGIYFIEIKQLNSSIWEKHVVN